MNMEDEMKECGPPRLVAQNMSLRDWFAGQALAAIISTCRSDTRENGETREQMFARRAYDIADALLSARGEPK